MRKLQWKLQLLPWGSRAENKIEVRMQIADTKDNGRLLYIIYKGCPVFLCAHGAVQIGGKQILFKSFCRLRGKKFSVIRGLVTRGISAFALISFKSPPAFLRNPRIRA